MIFFSKRYKFSILLLAFIFFITAKISFADLTMQDGLGRISYSGIFLSYLPICINGAIVIVQPSVEPSVTTMVLFQYGFSQFHLWGPLEGSVVGGNYFKAGTSFLGTALQGICWVPTPFGVYPIFTEGTIQHIGTSLLPNAGFRPIIIPRI